MKKKSIYIIVFISFLFMIFMVSSIYVLERIVYDDFSGGLNTSKWNGNSLTGSCDLSVVSGKLEYTAYSHDEMSEGDENSGILTTLLLPNATEIINISFDMKRELIFDGGLGDEEGTIYFYGFRNDVMEWISSGSNEYNWKFIKNDSVSNKTFDVYKDSTFFTQQTANNNQLRIDIQSYAYGEFTEATAKVTIDNVIYYTESSSISIYLISPEDDFEQYNNKTIHFECNTTEGEPKLNLSLYVDGILRETVTNSTENEQNLTLTKSINFSNGNHQWYCSATTTQPFIKNSSIYSFTIIEPVFLKLPLDNFQSPDNKVTFSAELNSNNGIIKNSSLWTNQNGWSINETQTFSFDFLNDSFSTDTTSNYTKIGDTCLSGNATLTNKSITDGKFAFTIETLNCRALSLIGRNNNNLITAGEDFDIQVDAYKRTGYDSYTIGIGLWNDTKRSKYVELTIGTFGGGSKTVVSHNSTYYSGGSSTSLPSIVPLRIKRVDNNYSFFINNSLVYSGNLSELDGEDLYYGVLNKESSWDSGTAYSTYDNWIFKEPNQNETSIENIYFKKNITSNTDWIIQMCNINDECFFAEDNFTIYANTNTEINIINPLEITYGTNISIPLNYTMNEKINTTCWYKVVNSTSNIIINNQTLSNCENSTFNVPRDDTYTLTIYANDTVGNIGSDEVIFAVSSNSPTINIIIPTHNYYINHSENINFSFLVSDTDGIDTCNLWSTFNNSWETNETFNSVSSGIQFSTFKNLKENNYSINLWCNDSGGLGAFYFRNNTFTIDTTFPVINIDSITTTAGSQTLTIENTINDTNLNSCKYDIFNSTGSIDGLNNDVPFNCNSNFQATTTSYGNFILSIYSIDLAGNEKSINQSFILNEGGITTISGGSTTIISGNANWTMETAPGIFTYVKSQPAGTRTDLTIDFENTGEEDRIITLSCQDVKRDMCQYVNFTEKTFDLPIIKGEILKKKFTITLPKEIQKGEYIFNIIATDEEKRTRSITAKISTGGEDILIETLSKIVLKTEKGVPYWLIFFPLLGFLLFLTTKTIPKKTPVKFLLVIGLSGFISLTVIYFI